MHSTPLMHHPHTLVVVYWSMRLCSTSRCVIRLVLWSNYGHSRKFQNLNHRTTLMWLRTNLMMTLIGKIICMSPSVGGNIWNHLGDNVLYIIRISSINSDTIIILTRCRCYSVESSINEYSSIESRLWQKRMVEHNLWPFYGFSISTTSLQSFVPHHCKVYSIMIGHRAHIRLKKLRQWLTHKALVTCDTLRLTTQEPWSMFRR